MATALHPPDLTIDRDELVRRYLPLARRLAARYRHTRETPEDLAQVAAIGLVLAADRFDAARGVSFATFAVPTILGELRRHLRDHGWAARVPRGLQENVLRVTAARDDLSGELGRSPTPRELSEASGLGTETVLEAIEAASAYEAESLDQVGPADDESGEPLYAAIGSEELGYEAVEYGVSVGPAWEELTPAERAAVRLRFVDDLTQSEIAARIGVSQMQVSRLLRRALNRLQSAAAA